MGLWLQDDWASRINIVRRAVLFSAVTLFVLFLFQPFGTHEDTVSYKYLRLSGYGVVTFCAIFLSGVFEIRLSRYTLNSKVRWTVIPLVYIGLVAVFNHSYFVVAILGSWYWQNQVLFVFYTLAIGLFPISFMFLVNYQLAKPTEATPPVLFGFKADLERVVPINNNALQAQLFTIVGESKRDILKIDVAQVLFIKSADNYCELVILDGVGCRRELLRSTLTNIIKQLPKDAPIHRCHRSYLVNLGKVKSSSGNANGLQLVMQIGDEIVPVSRTYVGAIKDAL